MTRLRGASSVIRPHRSRRSFATENGATTPSAAIQPTTGPEATGANNGLFLVQLDAEELGRDVGLFLGGLVHDGLRVCDSSIQRQGSGRGGKNFH